MSSNSIIIVVRHSSSGEITRKLAREKIPEILALSPVIIEQRLNSGARRIDNRIGWAMSHLTKAGLIKKVKRATYTITPDGTDFLDMHRDTKITYHQLEALEGYREAWDAASAKRQDRQETENKPSREVDASTPDELIESAFKELNHSRQLKRVTQVLIRG